MKKTILSLMLLATGVASAMEPQVPVETLPVVTQVTPAQITALGAIKADLYEMILVDGKAIAIDVALIPWNVTKAACVAAGGELSQFVVKHPRFAVLAGLGLGAGAACTLGCKLYNWYYADTQVLESTVTQHTQQVVQRRRPNFPFWN